VYNHRIAVILIVTFLCSFNVSEGLIVAVSTARGQRGHINSLFPVSVNIFANITWWYYAKNIRIWKNYRKCHESARCFLGVWSVLIIKSILVFGVCICLQWQFSFTTGCAVHTSVY